MLALRVLMNFYVLEAREIFITLVITGKKIFLKMNLNLLFHKDNCFIMVVITHCS